MSKPHKKVCEFLDSINVSYIIEEIVKYYSLDIYLPNYNLAIEVMGDFWHSNPIIYPCPKYRQQKNSRTRDKSKHTYVKNHYGYEILYLWENDINENPSMCIALINEYISKQGILCNYNSYNYSYTKNTLELNKEPIMWLTP